MALSSNFGEEGEAGADIVRIIGEHLRQQGNIAEQAFATVRGFTFVAKSK